MSLRPANAYHPSNCTCVTCEADDYFFGMARRTHVRTLDKADSILAEMVRDCIKTEVVYEDASTIITEMTYQPPLIQIGPLDV